MAPDAASWRMWCPAQLLLLVVALASSDDAVDFHKNLPAQVVWAVSGQDAQLPCNVTPPSASDHVNMVLWFKDSGVPLYSLDARDRSLEEAHHLVLSDDLGARLNFQATVGSGIAELRINNVSLADEGVFRCRVDFRNSPTVNFRLNLTIVVPPSMPVIYDDRDREITGMAGPFLEGYDMYLACKVKGGRPRPEVTWWAGGLLRDSSVDFMTADETLNRLFVRSVHRSLWNSFVECRARSTTLSPPLVRRVQLDIYLKPKGVQVVSEEKLLSAGKLHNLTCTTWGSVPPARITWVLDGEPLRHPQTTEEETFNTTTSTLMFRPGAMDFGKELACRAENPHFPGGVLEDRRRLYVAYPPAVFVQLETNSGLPSLKEGDDVRLMCEVRSNPQPDRVTWFHGDRMLYANTSAVIFPSQRTVLLKGVTRASSGEYSCVAANREGETRSSPMRIRVQYAPRCRPGREFVTIGALRRDPVKVLCEVDADPGDEELRFSWTLQRDREVLPLPGTRATKRGAVSELVYTPVAESDFGTLACWASNSVGRQETPCSFHVIHARTPQPPGSCVVRNDSMTAALEVVCSPGDDGGLAQHFILEVRSDEQESQEPGAMSDQPPLGPPLHALRGPTPHFTVQGLKPGTRYRLDVFAENRKGRSHPPVLLSRVAVWPGTQSLMGPDSQNHGEDTSDSKASKATQPMAVVLAVLVAAAAIIVVGVFTTAALVMCRRRRLQQRLAKERTSYRVRFSADPPISVQDEGGGRTSLEPDLIVSRAQMTMEIT